MQSSFAMSSVATLRPLRVPAAVPRSNLCVKFAPLSGFTWPVPGARISGLTWPVSGARKLKTPILPLVRPIRAEAKDHSTFPPNSNDHRIDDWDEVVPFLEKLLFSAARDASIKLTFKLTGREDEVVVLVGKAQTYNGYKMLLASMDTLRSEMKIQWKVDMLAIVRYWRKPEVRVWHRS